MNLTVLNLPSPPSVRPGAVAVGVEVGSAIIRAGVFTKGRHLLGKTKITTRIERGPVAVMGRIAKCIRYAIDECDLQMAQVARIGVAVPGRIAGGAVVESCPELLWENVPLQAVIAGQFEIPVSIGQLHELATLGILSSELDRPVNRFAAIFVAPQCGAGVCLDGEWQDLTPLRIDDGDAERLRRNILAARPHPLFGQFRGRDFRKALKKTENLALREYVGVLADAAGECAARIQRRFAPEVIVLGGGLLDETKDEILSRAQARFEQIVSTSRTVHEPPLRLTASRLGDLAPITGAAVWAEQQTIPSTPLAGAV